MMPMQEDMPITARLRMLHFRRSRGESYIANMRPEALLDRGYEIALELLAEWAAGAEGPKTVHAAWLHGMNSQHRDVVRTRRRWETLDQADRDLDASIVRDVISEAIRALALDRNDDDAGTGS